MQKPVLTKPANAQGHWQTKKRTLDHNTSKNVKILQTDSVVYKLLSEVLNVSNSSVSIQCTMLAERSFCTLCLLVSLCTLKTYFRLMREESKQHWNP